MLRASTETMFSKLSPWIITCTAIVFAGLAGIAAEKEKKTDIDLSKLPAPSTKGGLTYAKDIKPIFDQSCVKCHGAEKPKARLRLDSLQGALKGGEDGKVIKPGDSAGSPMVHSISYLGDPDFHMPPPHNKANIPRLTNEQVGLIRAWIDQGAK